MANVAARRTTSPLGFDHWRPAHPIGKSRPNLAGSDSQRLDVGRTRAWLDQYENHSWRDLLRTHHPHRSCLSDVRQGHDAANVFRYQLDISCESPASAAFSYEIPVLDHSTSEVTMGEFVMELWAFMRERKKFWLLPIILVLLMLGTLIVLTQGSAVAPFVYTLF